jgi:Na+-driven multidrug efflux pump
LGMPAAAFLGTAQAACLGMQDVHSPLVVIAVAALMNLVLDVLLVGQPQAWLGGAAGAAWATLISQYFAAGLFLQWLCRSRTTSNKTVSSTPLLSGRRMSDMFRRRSKTTPKPISQPDSDDKDDSFSTRGFLAERLNWRQVLLPRPTVDIWDGFKPYVIPVTTTQVGRCSAYIALGHTVSSCFGTVSMAANQIITSIFYALIPIADSLGLTAQSFLPAMVAQPPSRKRTAALQQIYWNLLKVAGIYGLVLAAMVGCIPIASNLFTTDPAVLAMVLPVVPILLIIFSLHGVFCGAEGILLAQKDLGFIGRMYAIYFAVVPYLMWRVKRAALQGVAAVNLTTVWQVFLAYQLVRISVWVGRVSWLQRQDAKEASLLQP